MSDSSSEASEESEPRNADTEDEWVPEEESGEAKTPAKEQDEYFDDYESDSENEVRHPCMHTYSSASKAILIIQVYWPAKYCTK